MGEQKTGPQYMTEPNFNIFLCGISKVAAAIIIGDLKIFNWDIRYAGANGTTYNTVSYLH